MPSTGPKHGGKKGFERPEMGKGIGTEGARLSAIPMEISTQKIRLLNYILLVKVKKKLPLDHSCIVDQDSRVSYLIPVSYVDGTFYT